MKKLISLLCIFSMLGVVSCSDSDGKSTAPESNVEDSTEKTTVEATEPESQTEASQEVDFEQFTITVPAEWVVKESSEGCVFEFDDSYIAMIKSDIDTSKEEYIESTLNMLEFGYDNVETFDHYNFPLFYGELASSFSYYLLIESTEFRFTGSLQNKEIVFDIIVNQVNKQVEHEVTDPPAEPSTESPAEAITQNDYLKNDPVIEFTHFTISLIGEWSVFDSSDDVCMFFSDNLSILVTEKVPECDANEWVDVMMGMTPYGLENPVEYKNCIFPLIYGEIDATPCYFFLIGETEYQVCCNFESKEFVFDLISNQINNQLTNANGGTSPTDKSSDSSTSLEFTFEGMYKIGTDLPAGEYMLFADDDMAYLCVSSDANQADIIYNSIFENNLIATFCDGEYVELSDCFAAPMEAVPDDITNLISEYIDTGAMYKVGVNLPSREYKLEATPGESAYYCVYSDSRHDDIVTNDIFDNSTYVSVADGQYLLLNDCRIVE